MSFEFVGSLTWRSWATMSRVPGATEPGRLGRFMRWCLTAGTAYILAGLGTASAAAVPAIRPVHGTVLALGGSHTIIASIDGVPGVAGLYG